MTRLSRPARLALPAALLASTLMSPAVAAACACGCGVFGVGSSSLFPIARGGQAWVEYDYLDQDHNRRGTDSAPAEDNPDKRIETHFLTLGGQYIFNRDWGVTVTVPYWQRRFDTTDEDSGAPVTARHGDFGDVRLTGVYTGLSADLSTGITFGVKLPTGDYGYRGFDRDTAIGTGSTDLLLGGYHHGRLNAEATFNYFVQAQWDRPIANQDGYRPGQEFDAAVGVAYSGWKVGQVAVTPILQVIGVHRDGDAGAQANPVGSGYDRVLVSPGVELSAAGWRLYGDVELPAYQNYRGDQLAATAQFKMILSKAF